MSTTFAVENNGRIIDVAQKSGSYWWTNSLASLLPDNTPVMSPNNRLMGIKNIGDIRKQIDVESR